MVRIVIVIVMVIAYVICDRNWDRDRDKNPALPAITQEDKIEFLRKENARFRAEEKERKIEKSKMEKKREDMVQSDHLAADAIKIKLKSNLCASKPVNQFEPLDISTKAVGTRPKTSKKGWCKIRLQLSG